MFTTPIVSTPTSFEFYHVSTLSSYDFSVEMVIRITINKCSVANCQGCLPLDYTTWSAWSTGYTLSSNTWSIATTGASSSSSNTSNLATAINISIYSLLVAALASNLFSNILDNSSIASFWSMLNQLQLLLLLLLTRSEFPQDVIEVIAGSSFTLFSFDFINFPSIQFITILKLFII